MNDSKQYFAYLNLSNPGLNKIKKIGFVVGILMVSFQFTCITGLKAQDTLELTTAIQIGLENNYQIKISKGNQSISENNNTIGNAGFLPTLDLTASQRYTLENTSQKFVSGQDQNRNGAKSNSLAAGAALNWTIFDGTKMFFTKNRLEELENEGIMINKSIVQDIVAQIAKEFYTVAIEQLRLDMMNQNIKLSEERMKIAKDKYDFGKASRMEYLQAQVDLNRDKSNLMIQKENVVSAKASLNELLGRDVKKDFYVNFNPELNKSLDYDELNEGMQTNNPDLLAARNEVNASLYSQKELYGERAPEISLNLGYNYAKSEAQAGFLLNRQSSGITYGISASWNLFDGFNLNRQIQNAKIMAENSKYNYESVKLNLEHDLYSIFVNYQNNIQLLDLEEENRKVAQENNDIALERYRIGNSSPLELREAQVNLLEANLSYLDAAHAIKTAEIDLLKMSSQLVK